MKVEKYIAYHICTNYFEDTNVLENIIRKCENINRSRTEEILENHRPCDVVVSRMNALFVCYDKENVEFWINKKFKNKPLYIYKLELTGNLYWFDAFFYEEIFECINSNDLNQRVESLSNSYWKEINPEKKYPALVEGLFTGKVIIKEIYTDSGFIVDRE